MLTDVKLRKFIAFTPLLLIPFIRELSEGITQYFMISGLIRPYITSLVLGSLVVLIFLLESIMMSFLLSIDEFLVLIGSMIISFIIYVGVGFSILLILFIITIVILLKLGIFKGTHKFSVKELSASFIYSLRNIKEQRDITMQCLGLLFLLAGLAILIQKIFAISNQHLYFFGVFINAFLSLIILARSMYALMLIPLVLLSWVSVPIMYSSFVSIKMPRVEVEAKNFIDLGVIKQKLIIKGDRVSWSHIKKPLHCAIPLKTTIPLHMIICGMSGSGKSTYLKYLVQELLLKNIEVIVIDPHGEHVHLAEELGGKVTQLGYDINITHMLQSQYVELRNIISVISGISKQQISRIFDELLEKASKGQDILLIDLMESLKLQELERTEHPWRLRVSVRPLNIIDLSKAQNLTIEKLVFELTLRSIWSRYSLTVSDNVRCAILVDEIYRFLNGNWQITIPSLGKILREGRKYGIIIVMTSQRVSSLPHDVITNTGVKMYFKLVDPREIGFAVASLALHTYAAEKLMKKTLAELDVGSAILTVPMLNLIAVIEAPRIPRYVRV